MAQKNYSEQNLADAFAATHNKAGWLMHEADEYSAVQEMFEKWYELYQELYEKIFEILREENINKNANHMLEGGTHYIAKPFMKRYGYRDGGGWWIKEEK